MFTETLQSAFGILADMKANWPFWIFGGAIVALVAIPALSSPPIPPATATAGEANKSTTNSDTRWLRALSHSDAMWRRMMMVTLRAPNRENAPPIIQVNLGNTETLALPPAQKAIGHRRFSDTD